MSSTAVGVRAALALLATASLLVVGCAKKRAEPRPEPVAGHDGGTGPGPGPAVDPTATLAIVSEEVTFEVGSRRVPGTLTRPSDAVAPRPAVLLLAGSGPTDRDWNNAQLPGTNGSARLLAETLARHGAVVLRYDKAFAGANLGPPVAELGFDTYLDETGAALALLRTRPEVDPARLFLAGHSEGGIHATRGALAAPGSVAGVIFLAAPGRTMADTMLTQLEGNFRDGARLPPEQVEAQMAPLRTAMADFLAGKPVDPTAVSPFPEIQQLLASLFAPASAVLARAMFAFDPAVEAARLEHPVLVLSGGKDVQIDAEIDTARLAQHLTEAGRAVTLHISPDADHTLKHEPRPLAALRNDLGGVQTGYNADGRVLDPDLVGALLDWLAKQTQPTTP